MLGEVRVLVAALMILSSSAWALPSPSPRPKAPKAAKAKVKAKAPKKRPPPVELTALNTREHYTLRPDVSGRFSKKELRGWNRFLRCHHTGRAHAMATRLASLIYETSKHFNFGKVLVVAGYRAPRVAKEKGNPKSPHKKGLAVDFRVEGVANTELRDYLRSGFARVGIGYYPNSDFVHLDVRQKVSAFWAAPGERSRYSKSPQEDVMAEKVKPEVEELETGAQTAANTAGNKEGSPPQGGPAKGAETPNSLGLVPLTP
jgi:uncharacterized protein YcbK (DUF882 family)